MSWQFWKKRKKRTDASGSKVVRTIHDMPPVYDLPAEDKGGEAIHPCSVLGTWSGRLI